MAERATEYSFPAGGGNPLRDLERAKLQECERLAEKAKLVFQPVRGSNMDGRFYR